MTVLQGENRARVAAELYQKYNHEKRVGSCKACGGDRFINYSYNRLGTEYNMSFATVRNLIDEHRKTLPASPEDVEKCIEDKRTDYRDADGS